MRRLLSCYYLSGPIAGFPDRNRPAFDRAARRLRALGHKVVNPHETSDACVREHGYPVEDYVAKFPKARQEFLKRDLTALLLTCDAIVMLPGWKQSRGATLEALLATQVGLKLVQIWVNNPDEFGMDEPIVPYTLAQLAALHAKAEANALAHVAVAGGDPGSVWSPPFVPDTGLPSSGSSTSSEMKSVLAEADALVNGVRQRDYGHPLDNFSAIAALWSAYDEQRMRAKYPLGAEGRPKTVVVIRQMPFTAEDVAMMMDLLKIARELKTPKRDNRVDGPGYWKCLDMIVAERAKRRETIHLPNGLKEMP